MELSALIEGMGFEHTELGDDPVRICDITEDSKTAVPGSLFVARQGTKERGSDHALEAIELGAIAVLTDDPGLAQRVPESVKVLVSPDAARVGCAIAERFYGDPSSALAIAAVTGTNGKTTVASMVDRIMDESGSKCGLISTVDIDDGRERSRAVLTTPPGIELSRTLATMREHGCVACAMEASSHALDQGRASAVRLAAGAFTNLTGDHLDYHGDMETYARAKATLFTQLGRGASAVVNIDDPASAQMLGACAEGVRKVTVSLSDGSADWRAHIDGASVDGMDLRIESPLGVIALRSRFFGSYNATNLLVALALSDALLEELGVGEAERFEKLSRGAPRAGLPRGRMERVESGGGGPRVFVDFAHTDDALASSLSAVRSVLDDGAALWCVFGCGGDRDRTKRPRMGRVVAEHADRVVLTSDNPRSEKPSKIVDDVLEGLDQGQRARVNVQVDRAQAIRAAVLGASDSDVVVISGKGHETEQITLDRSGALVTAHFDDAEHARAALRERRERVGA